MIKVIPGRASLGEFSNTPLFQTVIHKAKNP
jgi:hypothetical protein